MYPAELTNGLNFVMSCFIGRSLCHTLLHYRQLFLKLLCILPIRLYISVCSHIFSKWYHCVFFWNFLFLTQHCCWHLSFLILSSLFLLLLIFHYSNAPQFVFPFFRLWTSTLFSLFSSANSAAVAICFLLLLFLSFSLIF